MSFTVALLQLCADQNESNNISRGIKACRLAKQMGADIALFPEMYQNGYQIPEVIENPDTWKKQAIDQSDVFFLEFRSLARELDMAIALTYLEKWPGAPRNSVSIIDRHGEVVLTYAKVHTCDFGCEAQLSRGEDFHVCTLNTANGDVKLGAMICFDREFPESARILMLKGAEIILVPNACLMEENRKQQMRTRAYENMVGVALANYAAGNDRGHSMAFDCMAFNSDESSRDTVIIEAGESEGIFLADFDMEKIRHFRETEVWGNAFRRPEKYEILTSQKVDAPFVRSTKRR